MHTIDDTVPHLQFQLEKNINMTNGDTVFPSHNGSSPGDNGGFTPVFPLTVLLLYETDGKNQIIENVVNCVTLLVCNYRGNYFY